jgi:hypothetical protein
MRNQFDRFTRRRHQSGESGQSLMEFAICLPLVCILVLGVVEVGYALLDQQVVNKLSREGSNLISRDTSLQDAAVAMASMSSRPVNFSDGSSKLIFSVLRKGGTSGTANYNQVTLYQRYVYGSGPGSSKLNTAGSGSYAGPPDYTASNADNDTRLQITNLPDSLITDPNGMLYVTEIYSRHPIITPFDRFGVTVPQILYSIAYF